jgi:hypothetical protein
MIEEELGALSELLGDQPYMFGHRWESHSELPNNILPAPFASLLLMRRAVPRQRDESVLPACLPACQPCPASHCLASVQPACR